MYATEHLIDKQWIAQTILYQIVRNRYIGVRFFLYKIGSQSNRIFERFKILRAIKYLNFLQSLNNQP